MRALGINGMFNIFRLPGISELAINLSHLAPTSRTQDTKALGHDTRRFDIPQSSGLFSRALYRATQPVARGLWRSYDSLMPRVTNPIVRFTAAQGIMRRIFLDSSHNTNSYLEDLFDLGYSYQQIIKLLLDVVRNTDFEFDHHDWDNFSIGRYDETDIARKMMRVAITISGGEVELAELLRKTPRSHTQKRDTILEVLRRTV
ncbi:hypothetical protein KKF63_00405 [bacterium]|nr:hypothetical protein [bacterium]